MNADQKRPSIPILDASAPKLQHDQLTEKIIGTFYDVYNELGVGFLEAVYEEAMCIALADAGMRFARQQSVAVWFRGKTIGEYRADILVEDTVLLELKAARSIEMAFEKQLLNYLRSTDLEIGLLLNFGPKPQFRRFAFENKRKIRVHPRASAAKIGSASS